MTIILYILNVICSSGQSAVGKLYASKNGTSGVFNRNKAFAGFALFLIIGLINGLFFHVPTIIFGVSYGVFLCISMYSGFMALATGPLALTSIIVSFNLIIPFLFGILVWKESITISGIVGMICLLAAIVLINLKKGGQISVKWAVYVFVTLLVNGICSLIQKFHQLQYPGSYKTEFILAAYLCMFVLFIAAALFQKAKDTPATVPKLYQICPHGLIAGLMNVASNYIILYLAATEKASILFPMVSVSNVIAVWLLGRILFKERQRPLQTVGLLLGMFAIVLLNINR